MGCPLPSLGSRWIIVAFEFEQDLHVDNVAKPPSRVMRMITNAMHMHASTGTTRRASSFRRHDAPIAASALAIELGSSPLVDFA
jgi:hypothetical protein